MGRRQERGGVDTYDALLYTGSRGIVRMLDARASTTWEPTMFDSRRFGPKTALLALALIGCGDDDAPARPRGDGGQPDSSSQILDGGAGIDAAAPDAPPGPPGTPPADAASGAETAARPAADAARDDAGGVFPTTSVGVGLRRLFEILNGDPAAITAETIRELIHQPYSEVTRAEIAADLRAFAARYAPFAVVGVDPPRSPVSLIAGVRTGRGVYLRIYALAEGQDGRLTNYHFFPAADLDPTPRRWEEIEPRLKSVAPESFALVAEVKNDACAPIARLAAERPMALGALSRVYVLGALAAKIAAREAHWEDQLAVRDEWKSAAASEFKSNPAGLTLPLRVFASSMLSDTFGTDDSTFGRDDTAADHLLHAVGRRRVEAHQKAMGHRAPALNVPFLSTREMFALKHGATDQERAAYLAAAPEERRRLLDETFAKRALPPSAVTEVTGPPSLEGLGWFAAPDDLCDALVALRNQMDAPSGEPLRKLLGVLKATGVEGDESWLFEGGGELGVAGRAFLVKRADGRWFVAAGGYRNPAGALDLLEAPYHLNRLRLMTLALP